LLNRCREKVETQRSQHDGLPLSASPARKPRSFAEEETKIEDSKANDGEKTKKDWRELALRVQQEADPEKMIEFAELLVTKLDEEETRKNLLSKRRTESPERS
jgi:hypothetical protein